MPIRESSALRRRGLFLLLHRSPFLLAAPLSRSIASSSSSSSATVPVPALDITNPTYMIWGSNTGVGKTLVSTGLAASILSPSSTSLEKPSACLYLKPIQTGFPADSDARFVYRKVLDLFRRWQGCCPLRALSASNHVLNSSPAAAKALRGARPERLAEANDVNLGFTGSSIYEEMRVGGGESDEGNFKLVCKTFFGWNEAISPHLAVEREGMAVEDSSLRAVLARCLELSSGGQGDGANDDAWRIIETAGGVASPGPSGTLQCDLYRPFRLPSIIVGDGRLGGISSTIAAYECLTLRGYDVVAVLLEDHGLSNEVPLLSYLKNKLPVIVLPRIPEDPKDDLLGWFSESRKAFGSLQDIMFSAHSHRIHRLHDMQRKSGSVFWWPFTQHKLVPEEIVTVIDSRWGENFLIHEGFDDQEMIIPQYDACASWWTQGPDSTLQIELAKDMGYSAARYGHVMFPENVYEPALQCAELLLDGVGKGWASRTFFSDNGSTAIEVALKMAFRKYVFDHGIHIDSQESENLRHIQLRVLALKGSYHGDTLGAMEAQAPSSYTSFIQQPWYFGRGLYLDPPECYICDEVWTLSLPNCMQSKEVEPGDARFTSRDQLLCLSRDSSALAEIYSSYIKDQLLQFAASNSSIHIGALIIEPVIHGSGGMHIIDPLFQRILVRECRACKIPVIFDEVFSGFWRLGRESAAELLGCHPDIACFAKLLTGGIIPLAATLSTESVFQVFNHDSKLMALLHGHSYSAHALGCTAAAKAIQWFRDPCTNPNIISQEKKLKELWDLDLVHQISSLAAVGRVIALGTVFSVELKADSSNAGYGSLYASSLVKQLREDGLYVRPLGNVIYLMCGPCTSPHFCNLQLRKLYERMYEFSQHHGRPKLDKIMAA